MIYVIEGVHGAGKSTLAKTFNLPIEAHCAHNIHEAIEILESRDNVVMDRLFIYGFLGARVHNVQDLYDFNDYLKAHKDRIKCIKMIIPLDESFEVYHSRYLQKDTRDKEILKEEYNRKVYQPFVTILNDIMDVFEEWKE